MALARYILGKFLGVDCHFFPPPLDVPTFSARCLHVLHARDLQQRKVELLVGEKCSDKFGLESDFHVVPGIFYMPKICDMGQTALIIYIIS